MRTIYAQGIATGMATFETKVPTWEEWDRTHLPGCRLVALQERDVAGWAALGPVSSRPAYRGVAEVSVYVADSRRGTGIGSSLLRALIIESEGAGIWTLQSALFPQNEPSVRLHVSCGFRAVGRRLRIARLAGEWRDTLIKERRSDRVGGD